jgi:hypothetical protein
MWFAGLVICGGLVLGNACSVSVSKPFKTEVACLKALPALTVQWANRPFPQGAAFVLSDYFDYGCAPSRSGLSQRVAARAIWSFYGPHRKERA